MDDKEDKYSRVLLVKISLRNCLRLKFVWWAETLKWDKNGKTKTFLSIKICKGPSALDVFAYLNLKQCLTACFIHFFVFAPHPFGHAHTHTRKHTHAHAHTHTSTHPLPPQFSPGCIRLSLVDKAGNRKYILLCRQNSGDIRWPNITHIYAKQPCSNSAQKSWEGHPKNYFYGI